MTFKCPTCALTDGQHDRTCWQEQLDSLRLAAEVARNRFSEQYGQVSEQIWKDNYHAVRRLDLALRKVEERDNRHPKLVFNELAALGCPVQPSAMKYYKILGHHTGEQVGVCTTEGLEDVRKEEPQAMLIEITKSEFDAYTPSRAQPCTTNATTSAVSPPATDRGE
jgi:hypothetical protein